MTIVNIASHLTSMARQSPDQPAAMLPVGLSHNGSSTYESLTYQQLNSLSDSLARDLIKLGIGHGSRTVLMVPPSLEFFALTFALFKAGAISVFVDPGMGIKNIGKCLAEAQPEAFIGIPKAHLARSIIGWGKKSLRRLVAVGKGASWCRFLGRKITVWEGDRFTARTATSDDAADALGQTTAEEMAAILFTSGSTGVPKGAVYSHGNFAAQIEMLRSTFSIQPGEVDLCTFPLFALFAPALGMSAIVPRMDFTRPATVAPQEIAEPIRQHAVANLFGSPALLNRVGRFYEDSNERWPTVRRVLSAGAPVSPAIIERFAKRLEPGVQIFTPYGATESLPVAVIDSDEILADTRHQTARGAGTCVGRPVEGMRVAIIRIADDPISKWDESLLVKNGEIGEIVVDGLNVTQQYFNRPDLTALAKIQDWSTGRMRHRMGDLGYFDEQGRLWFCGRKSHRVVTPERTYFTEPIEGIFNGHPAVFRSALVGIQRGGRMYPVLCVEREESHRKQATEALTRELLNLGQQHEQSRVIDTILYHDAFPVDIRHNSKIFREKLAVWAQGQVNRGKRASSQ